MEKLHREDLQMKSEVPVEVAAPAVQAAETDNAAASGLSQRQLGELDGEQAHAVADAGLHGGGQALPFADKIQASFGRHDVSGVRAHTGMYASRASATLGAQAYTKGDEIAFGKAPDLHTAAHEAAHVVQQRAGVHLKSGVGESGDAYEKNADAVADAVVRGESAEPLLAQHAGPASTGGAVQSKAIQKIGVGLDEKLPAGQEAPAFGEIEHKQRKWSPDQYIAMWEKEQGRSMSDDERTTIKRGCIGITAANLNGGGNPLDYAEGIWGNFEQAHAAMVEKNKKLDADPESAGGARYVVFAKLFWSNQSSKWEDRLKPDDKAFKPDPKTGEVDMTGYNYKAQSKWDVDDKGNKKKSGYVNFDYGFWDESSHCFWHANHMDYGDPERPMIVLQSTKSKFIAGYIDFDRVIFCIARAHDYDPGLAAIAHARGG
jgi:hypothetical protein